MFGFLKRKKVQDNEIQARMHVIPDVFYGGNDPVIYHQKKLTTTQTKKKKKKKSVQKSHGDSSWLIRHKKKVLIIGAVLGILTIVSVAVWYYVQQLNTPYDEPVSPANEIVIPEVEETPIVPEPAAEVDVVTSTPTPEEKSEPVVVTSIAPVSFPRILLVDSTDADADELTDAEELIFSTNQDIWDTDEDGYYDGQEVINLYNPKGFSPVKLIDSGLIAEYTNPTWQYRLYYPIGWQVGEVDAESRQVLFSTLSGDFIEVRVFDRIPGTPFQQWFATAIDGETFQDLQQTTNRFEESGWRRKDGLVGYFLSDTHVTVLLYHPGVSRAIPYRNVMRMVYESFRSTNTTVSIPEQAILPTPPVFSTSTLSPSTSSPSISG